MRPLAAALLALAALAPSPAAAEPTAHLLGLSFVGDFERGVVRVAEAAPGFPAAAAGLAAGDVIRGVGRTQVSDLPALLDLIDAQGRRPTLFRAERDGAALPFMAVRPLPFPDAGRDRALYPYPAGFDAAPRLGVELDGRRYAPLPPEAVFDIGDGLWRRIGALEPALAGRRILFEALIACEDLVAPFLELHDPRDGLGLAIPAVPSALFDPKAGVEDARRCRETVAAFEGGAELQTSAEAWTRPWLGPSAAEWVARHAGRLADDLLGPTPIGHVAGRFDPTDRHRRPGEPPVFLVERIVFEGRVLEPEDRARGVATLALDAALLAATAIALAP